MTSYIWAQYWGNIAAISESVNPYSAGIDFSHQNLRQILTTKVDPRTVRVEIFLMAIDP